MTTIDSRKYAVNILHGTFLENEEKRFSIRYVLETSFEQVKNDLELEKISLYLSDGENGEKDYIATPKCMNKNFQTKIYGILHGFLFGCKTVKKQYSEAYYYKYRSANEIKFYRAETTEEVWIVGKQEEVDKICHEIEREISANSMDTRPSEPKAELSRSWENLVTTEIYLSLEEKALVYLHRLLDKEVFKNNHVIVKKDEPHYSVSVELHSVSESEKMHLESEIRQFIERKRPELFSTEIRYSSEVFKFLCRENVYEYVDKQLNYSRSNIQCTWSFDSSQCIVKIFSISEYRLKKCCDELKSSFKTQSIAVPAKFISTLKAKQKMSDLLSKYGQKLDIRLDTAGTMLHCIYTKDQQSSFSTDFQKILPVTRTIDIQGDEKRTFCKHHFTGIHDIIEDRYDVNFTDVLKESGQYGWILKGDSEDVQAADKELSTLVRNIGKKRKTYQTDDPIKTIQEHVGHLVKDKSCIVTVDEVIKSPLTGNYIDMRREILCHEWELPNGNFIKIMNTGNNRWVCKKSVVFHLTVKDNLSMCDCFYQPESSIILLYIPTWKKDGKEMHEVSCLLDNFYRRQPWEKPKKDNPSVLFLNDITKQGWPWRRFLKEFLLALSRNYVSSPLHIFEPNREIFETVSDIVQNFASQTSRQLQIQINVKTGELAKLENDAIVNSANESLSLNFGAVSKSILSLAGRNIQDECNDIMRVRRNKLLDSKEVVVSSGHNLKCKFVFHGALESWEKQTLSEFVYRCLREADLRKLSSLAFPSLGTGQKNYPPDNVAKIMFQTVQKYDIERTIKHLKEVDFVIYEKDFNALKAFKTAEEKIKTGFVKEERRLKCPDPYVVKVTVTGEYDPTVDQIFSKIEEHLKTNIAIAVPNPPEPTSQTIERTDIPTTTYPDESLSEEEKTYLEDLQKWSGSGGSNNTKVQKEAAEPVSEATGSIGEPCYVNVMITDSDHHNVYDNLARMLDRYGIKEENVIWCPFTPNEARIRFNNESAANSLIDKTKQEEKYQLKMSNTDAVINIKAKLNISVSVYLVESNQRVEILKRQSGVAVLNEDDGTVTLMGDLSSISSARDILLKWKYESLDVKSPTGEIGRNDQGKNDFPGSSNQSGSGFQSTGTEGKKHEANKMFDSTSQNKNRDINPQAQTKTKNLDNKTIQSDSHCHTGTYKFPNKTKNDDLNVENSNNSSSYQLNKDNPQSSAYNCNVNDPQSRTKAETYHDKADADKPPNYFNENAYEQKHLQPNDRHGGINNSKPDEHSRSVRPKECKEEKYYNRDPKSFSQKRAIEVGDKDNNVSGASGGCQPPEHKIYPNLFTEPGNKIDIENPPDEPASPSPDTLNKINNFPDVNDDFLMMTTKEGIKVYVYQGNLCYLNVRAIVNSSNDYMKHTSGLFSVIAKAAGEKMITQCQRYLDDNTRLQQGKVCVTTAGDLKHYANILHVCAPVWARRTNTESYIEGLKNVIRSAMIAADDYKLRSVAIPAIGSGGLGGPRQVCFSSFPRAVALYSSKFGRTTSIKEIHFVDRDLEVVTLMQTAFLLDLDESQHGKNSKLLKIPKKIKETFLCYVGNETASSKYQSTVLPNKVNALLCDGPLFSVPRHKHGEKMCFKEEDTGLVITIDKELTGKSQSASLCLQRCGNDFHWNFDNMKKQKNKSYGEAYDTFGDKQLKFGHVICPVMPPLSDKAADKTSPAQQQFQSIFRQSCANLFKKADSCDVKHLAVPVLVDDFYDLNSDWFLWLCTNSMMIELHNFANKRKKKSGITVHFATNKNENLYQICKASLSNPDRSGGTGKRQPVGKEQTTV